RRAVLGVGNTERGSPPPPTALLALLGAGEGGGRVAASSQLYGGTVDLLTDTFADFGYGVDFVDQDDPAAWAAAIGPGTRAVLLESITNPLATLPDLPAIARTAHAAGVPVVVDNTLATPALYRPFEHGADVVVHSATKFLGGHGTTLAGVLVDGGTFDFAADPVKWSRIVGPRSRYGGASLWERHGRGAYLAYARSKYLHDLGPALAPSAAAEILRGTETLRLRVERHGRNAVDVARFLDAHPAVARVHHPSVPGHPGEGIAARDFPDGTGSVFSFDLAVDPERDPGAVARFIDALRLFKLVANLGDTRSLVAHPAAMTHCRLTPAQRAAAGIGEATIRLSVGLEEPADLTADLAQAFAAAGLVAEGSVA
ncbi:aminotransferase class V-fold PLP-dependent enzyme, partial [Zafaria sp. J156]|uniref:aminotransferase class V-fold PLP-dependent enzyme n=1 Tax=Zafaria sp. J156 TaxID=3116490 RepID=UPI002E767049